jgi:outer membrane protein OmpA-like peptidoglycan-associated protein
MSSQRDDDDDTRPVVWAVLIGAIVLAVGLALGFGIAKSMKGVASGGSASAAASSSANGAAAGASDAAGSAGAAAGATGNTQAAGAQGAANAQGLQLRDDESRVVVEGGVVKFYFASGKADLAEGADQALVAVIQAVAAGKKAIVSGYHDTTGNAQQNEALYKQRAIAVRDTLVRLGVGDDKIDLRKPENTTAAGSNAEARRVEVTLE